MAQLQQIGSMLRLVARGITSRGAGEPLPEVPKRKPAVERVYPGVDPALHARYLHATGGDGVERLAAGVLSPVFPATWETAQAWSSSPGWTARSPPAAWCTPRASW